MTTERFLDQHRALLADVLARDYSLRGELVALAGERDANLRLRTESGDLLVKVVADTDDADDVALQIAALTHLEHNAPDLPVPRVVRTGDGKTSTSIAIGGGRTLWVSTWLDGHLVADLPRIGQPLCDDLGRTLGRLNAGLRDFHDARAQREFKWDLLQADWIAADLHLVECAELRAIVADVQERYGDVQGRLGQVRTSVAHNDANDHNLLVAPDDPTRIAGLIDFGDLCLTATVAEVAIAASYAAMAADDPLAAIDAVTRGFDRELPLTDVELELIVPLVETRLAVSVVNAAAKRRLRPGDAYVDVSQAGARRLLQLLHGRDHAVAAERLRAVCGRPPSELLARVRDHLRAADVSFAPVLHESLRVAEAPVVDLSFSSLIGGDDPTQFDAHQATLRLDERMRTTAANAAIGRYGEPRPIYSDDAFGDGRAFGHRRTVHLGIDVFAPAGSEVHAPLDGVVHRKLTCPGELDYGGLVVLRHELADGTAFGTLYGHLSPDSTAALRVGDVVQAGRAFARLGDARDNGGWPPHLHLQVLAADPERLPEVPRGVADPDDRAAHIAVYPDPSPLLGLKDARAIYRDPDRDLQAARGERFAGNLATSYDVPFAPVRGIRHLLFDSYGRRYLDAYNNVPHVGHCHPRVVAAIREQTGLIATNTRYLHEGMHRYAERLQALLPKDLCVFFFTPSGSEANELALRLARQHTGARDLCVMDHGYHGHTTGALAISPYKLCQPGAPPQPDWVHVTVQPDVYRGEHRGADAGVRYAQQVAARIAQLHMEGRRLSGYLCECLPSVGGQLELPDGFLREVYEHVRAAGGLCIADDVQTALWRTGEHAFGFERHGVVPDVLVLGKPLGNGFPLGAVVTTRAVADSFAHGPEFFSTFGGSTVAMAAGLAVLDVLEEQQLASNACTVGQRLLDGLQQLQQRHEVIGDVRGRGFFLGVELVRDRDDKQPHRDAAAFVKNRLRQRRVLIGTDGPFDNVLKIRPPMTFDAAGADHLLQELDVALREQRG